MIYISSSCVKHNKIKDSVQDLVDNGFKNIELSGGTEYYDGFENDLFELKEKYNLNYICHNYFPPPKEHFVLNLASTDDNIYYKSIEYFKSTINLSKRLGCKKFGFHAGFFLDIKVSQIGKEIDKVILSDKQIACKRFFDAYKILLNESKDIKLYIENNVFSSTNYGTYDGINPFMLTTYEEFLDLKNNIEFNLLLDIAHLKVSTKTLGLNFKDEFSHLILKSNYIHVSENDGLHDINSSLYENSELLCMLKEINLNNKDFTIEVYDKMDKIKASYKILQKVILD